MPTVEVKYTPGYKPGKSSTYLVITKNIAGTNEIYDDHKKTWKTSSEYKTRELDSSIDKHTQIVDAIYRVMNAGQNRKHTKEYDTFLEVTIERDFADLTPEIYDDQVLPLLQQIKNISGGSRRARRPSRKYKKSAKRVFRKKSRSTRRR
jgi:hypothetical protein